MTSKFSVKGKELTRINTCFLYFVPPYDLLSVTEHNKLAIWLVYGHHKVSFNGGTEPTLSWIDIRGRPVSCSDGEPISVSLHSHPDFVCGLLERAMNSAWPSFHYRPDWSVSKRQEGAGHGSTVAQVSWARGGKSCQSNWTYLLPIHSPRLAHVCCATLGSGSLYITDSASAASFCMPLFSMTKAGMNIQENCFCALLPPSMQLYLHVPSRGKKSCLFNTTQNCIGNGGKIVSNICHCDERDLTKHFNPFKQCLNECAT